MRRDERIKRRFLRDPALVLYLPLYELDGVSFMSKDGYGHRSTVTGATWGSQGRTFDGTDDAITIPDNNVLDMAGAFSVGLWFNHYAAESGTAVTPLVIKGSGFGAQSNYYLTVYQDTRGYFDVYTGTVRKSLELNPTGGGALAIGTWYLLFGVYDGINQIAYLNGAVNRTINIGSVALDADASNLCFGKDVSYFGTVTTGEAWLYNRALTPLEVQQIYLSTRWRYVG